MRLLPVILAAALILTPWVGNFSFAQANAKQPPFKTGNKIIFRGDFNNDTIGRYPGTAQWKVKKCLTHEHPVPHVTRVDSDKVLKSECSVAFIEPNTNYPSLIKDNFTVEYDFKMLWGGSVACISFYDTSIRDNKYRITSRENGTMFANNSYLYRINFRRNGTIATEEINGKIYQGKYHTAFDGDAWHHFAFSYIDKQIKCYVDNDCALAISDTISLPDHFFLSCYPTVVYKNIVVATNEKSKFDEIITKKRFVTHAIRFGVNSPQIKPESFRMIEELATWLKENKEVKLQISGHADTDGDAAANMSLSDARALAVKKRLVKQGVDANRLFAKGYGATKPIETNSTPEGKAVNRRVEFVLR
jgi:outer membrane protein OmpA-like peptidoglycan-associated protein